jgi:hypothetical protein
MSVRTGIVTVAGILTMIVPHVPVGMETVAKTSVNACIAPVVIPAEDGMSLIMAVVVAVVILAVLPVAIVAVVVIVMLKVWLVDLPSGTDVTAVNESAARVGRLVVSVLLFLKNRSLLRRTKRLFTLVAKRERSKRRSKWGVPCVKSMFIDLDHVQLG